jgi:hypothetical protein
MLGVLLPFYFFGGFGFGLGLHAITFSVENDTSREPMLMCVSCWLVRERRGNRKESSLAGNQNNTPNHKPRQEQSRTLTSNGLLYKHTFDKTIIIMCHRGFQHSYAYGPHACLPTPPVLYNIYTLHTVVVAQAHRKKQHIILIYKTNTSFLFSRICATPPHYYVKN